VLWFIFNLRCKSQNDTLNFLHPLRQRQIIINIVMLTFSCTPNEIPAWWKQFLIVFSVSHLRAFPTLRIASKSVTVWSCFFSVHSIILSSISLWKWHFRLLITPWFIGCNTLVAFAGKNNSLMFFKFQPQGVPDSYLWIVEFFAATVPNHNDAAQLQTNWRPSKIFCLCCSKLACFLHFLST
jgi:hypothetical protein